MHEGGSENHSNRVQHEPGQSGIPRDQCCKPEADHNERPSSGSGPPGWRLEVAQDPAGGGPFLMSLGGIWRGHWQIAPHGSVPASIVPRPEIQIGTTGRERNNCRDNRMLYELSTLSAGLMTSIWRNVAKAAVVAGGRAPPSVAAQLFGLHRRLEATDACVVDVALSRRIGDSVRGALDGKCQADRLSRTRIKGGGSTDGMALPLVFPPANLNLWLGSSGRMRRKRRRIGRLLLTCALL